MAPTKAAVEDPPDPPGHAFRVQEIPISNTVKQAAALLQVGITTVYGLLQTGELKGFSLGRKRLITGESIAELLRVRVQAGYERLGDAPPLCRERPTGRSKRRRRRA
jgi:excisionase family DNA binding protein